MVKAGNNAGAVKITGKKSNDELNVRPSAKVKKGSKKK